MREHISLAYLRLCFSIISIIFLSAYQFFINKNLELLHTLFGLIANFVIAITIIVFRCNINEISKKKFHTTHSTVSIRTRLW